MTEVTSFEKQLSHKHFYSLDFLKFVLALIIVFHHFQQILGVRFEYFNFYNGTVPFQYVVEFFFLISGFVQSVQFSNKPIGCFKDWMARKLIRILPMAVLSILVCLPVYGFRKFFSQRFNSFNFIPGIWNIVASCTCVFAGGGIRLSSLGVNNPLWYVSVLFICYVILFCLNRLAIKTEISIKYFCIAMIFLGLGVHYYDIDLPFLNCYSCRGFVPFFLVFLLYGVYSKYSHNLKLFVTSLFTVLICTASMLLEKMFDDSWAILIFLLFPSLMFVFLFLEKFFVSKFTSILGGVSFEMYVWHFPLILIYSTIREYFCLNAAITFPIMILFSLGLIIFCSPLYLFVEKRLSELCNKRIF